ncbi:MAG: hypothetical protein ACRD2W_01795 [Acidimicrobiales bacterium]
MALFAFKREINVFVAICVAIVVGVVIALIPLTSAVAIRLLGPGRTKTPADAAACLARVLRAIFDGLRGRRQPP